MAAFAMPSAGLGQRAQRQDPQVPEQIVETELQTEREPAQRAPGSALDSLSPEEWQAAIENLRAEIQEEESREGPSSADLIGSFTALGALYREADDHVLAAAAIRRAVELVRYNYGLHSLEQARLIRQLIECMEALGDAETAWNLEQDLLALAERHPEDLRTARILRETADRRMDVLRRYSAGEWPPEIVLGCYYSPTRDRDCASGSRGLVKRLLLGEAQSFYAQSINVLVQNGRYGSEDLRELLLELVNSSYTYGTPNLGARSLLYLLAFQTMNDESWLARMETLVQIADWDLLYSHGRNEADEALTTYERAYALLEERGIDEAVIERIFSPSTPVVLPVFTPNPLASEKLREATGHIDVSFEITKYGEARKVQVVEKAGSATRSDQRRLTELIVQSRFRPRTTNGQFDDSERVVVRYRFGE